MRRKERKKGKREKVLKILEKTNLGSFSTQSFYLAISFYSKMSFCHANISFKMFKDSLRQFQDKNKKIKLIDYTEKKEIILTTKQKFPAMPLKGPRCWSQPTSLNPSPLSPKALEMLPATH